jgi:hydrogenase-1 operon protein HyaF
MHLEPHPPASRGSGTPSRQKDEATPLALGLPAAQDRREPPRQPQTLERADCAPALALLERLHQALETHQVQDPPVEFDLSDLDPTNRRLLAETLGEGEVSAHITAPAPARVQETRFAGVWWVRRETAPNEPPGTEHLHLEVADLPGLVRARAFHGAADQAGIPQSLPPGVMNAPAVLIEVNAQAAQWRPGEPPHQVNLTLLPQTPADLALLDQALGHGQLTLESRGYGSCRVASTAVRNLWRVRYFNTQDQMILDTLEVTGAPIAVLAAQEDLEDSARRLAECLAVLG